MTPSPVPQLITDISQGNRPALARAITILESTRADHRLWAEEILDKLLSKSGHAMRIAISGPPGVGKSSFIETLGLHLVNHGKNLAVLAIDPSSPLTGGSILGDKTRMEELSKSENCFIRPSPSSGALGGVARHTRETILLCEAAGFDVILIETVGIGQSEIMAASMTDIFVQLHQPYSGDELQGIKKGVMELADLVVITKADGDFKTAADLARADLERAISLTRSADEEKADVLISSAHANIGIHEAWRKLETIFASKSNSGALYAKRRKQSREWLQQEIESELHDLLSSHPRYEETLKSIIARVESSGEHCGRAARGLVHSLLTLIP